MSRYTVKIALVLLITLSCAFASHAGSVTRVDVDSDGSVYRIRLEMTMEVAAEHVNAVLTDYRHIYRLNPAIVESRVLSAPDENAARVYTRMEGCVLFYCKQFTRVEDVHELESGELLAVMVPEMSDFDAGTARWRVSREGEGSRLVYEAHLQPEFFIPPLIGSYFVKEKLRDELMVVFQRIECNARARLWAEEPGDMETTGNTRKSMAC